MARIEEIVMRSAMPGYVVNVVNASGERVARRVARGYTDAERIAGEFARTYDDSHTVRLVRAYAPAEVLHY